jgi:hypothetical protein
MASELSEEDRTALMRLKEAMWREETRFDKAFMERALAPDFFEFGRHLGAAVPSRHSLRWLGARGHILPLANPVQISRYQSRYHRQKLAIL